MWIETYPMVGVPKMIALAIVGPTEILRIIPQLRKDNQIHIEGHSLVNTHRQALIRCIAQHTTVDNPHILGSVFSDRFLQTIRPRFSIIELISVGHRAAQGKYPELSRWLFTWKL